MSRAKLLIAVGVAFFAIGVATAFLLVRAPAPVEQTGAPPAAPSSPASPAPRPGETSPPPAAPPSQAAVPSAPGAPSAPQPLLAELNAALPGLGVTPPARLVAADARGDHLTLTFSTEFRPYLASVSALDELIAALSDRIHPHGYRHLDLLLRDEHGQTVSIDELVKTPPARRPRPEPIDDGVRR